MAHEQNLTIRKNDLLEIICKRNNAWWKARSETGKEGLLPSNHVVKRDSLESEPGSETRPTDFSLSIRDNESIKHYRIRLAEDGRLYIVRRTAFSSLRDLVSHYSKQADGLCINLRRPCIQIVKPEPEGRRLGQEQFGDVCEGLWNNSTPVAIKRLKSVMKVNLFTWPTIENRQGATTATAVGSIALIYSLTDTAISYGCGVDDELNTLASGTLAGLIYRSISGLQSAAREGLAGLAIAGVVVLATSRDRLKQYM
ncbi:unnamed protein product [Didymodactylos carnosus]|uniref:Uncharacterized protein n=2 Tax=Didymodactylos carnosus TaxID=1234261 RepID=A0A8S2E528_9BILA|nr:unnamed protein product [Didymodactylos carnosus]CAF3851083.1 unnamed protein product [Didymodactylos carnosus]